MRDAFKETGRRLWLVVLAGFGAVLSHQLGELVTTARTNWTLALHEAPPAWLTEKSLVPWVQPALGVFISVSMMWALWPAVRGVMRWVIDRLRMAGSAGAPSQYGATPRASREELDKCVIGARAQDETSVTIGPMPFADARKAWAEPASEYIPLDEAGRWLYDNGEQWLKDWLKAPEPFKSITHHAAALVGTACDEGAGLLVASLEPGLKPEPVKYKDLHHTGPDAALGGKPPPVDPLVRQSDLPSILAHYRKPFSPNGPQHVAVRRDTSLREALMFIATRQWGQDPMINGGGYLQALSSAVIDFRQHAHDGTISVWGKADNHGVWQVIKPDYWVGHYIDFLDVLKSETRTKAYNALSNEPLFIELMVSRSEFEAEWRERSPPT